MGSNGVALMANWTPVCLANSSVVAEAVRYLPSNGLRGVTAKSMSGDVRSIFTAQARSGRGWRNTREVSSTGGYGRVVFVS